MLSVSSIFLEPTTHSLVLIRSKLVDIYGKFHDFLHTLSLFSDTSGGRAESGSSSSCPRLYNFHLVGEVCVCVCVCVCVSWHLLFLFIWLDTHVGKAYNLVSFKKLCLAASLSYFFKVFYESLILLKTLWHMNHFQSSPFFIYILMYS